MSDNEKKISLAVYFCGKPEAGKTTAAGSLKQHGFVEESFGTFMKDVAREFFGWNGEKDPIWGRPLLQRIGTELGRAYKSDFWEGSMARRLGVDTGKNGKGWLFADCMTDQYIADSIIDFHSMNRHESIEELSLLTKGYAISLMVFGAPALHSGPHWSGRSPSDELCDLLANFDRKKGSIEWVEKDNLLRMIERLRPRVPDFSAQTCEKLVVHDMRYKSEIAAVKEMARSTIGIWVEKPGKNSTDGTEAAKHIVENSLSRDDCDIVVENSGSVEDLHEKILAALNEVKRSRVIDTGESHVLQVS